MWGSLHVCCMWASVSSSPAASAVLQGLDVGQCALLLHVRPCEGLVRQLDGSIEKRFSPKHLLYPIQVISDAQYLNFQQSSCICFLDNVAAGCSNRELKQYWQ